MVEQKAKEAVKAPLTTTIRAPPPWRLARGGCGEAAAAAMMTEASATTGVLWLCVDRMMRVVLG